MRVGWVKYDESMRVGWVTYDEFYESWLGKKRIYESLLS